MPAKPTARNPRPVRSTRAPEKKTAAEKRATPSTSDQTVLRTQIKTSISSVNDISKILETATPLVQEILRTECSVIYECRVCLNLFRSVANFINHKRAYCLTRYQDTVIDTEKHHERTLIVQPGGSNVIYSRSTSKKDITLMLDSIASRARSDGIYFDTRILKPIPGTDEADKIIFEDSPPKQVDIMTLGPSGKVLGSSPTSVEENLTCSFCSKIFKSTKSLNIHVRAEHGSLTMCMVCPCCKKYFANSWSVYRHLYKVHQKSSDQVRKLRPQIQKKEVTLEEFNKSRKLLNGSGTEESSQKEDNGFSEELKYMEQKCHNCGRKFERKVALIAHSRACQKKVTLPQPMSNANDLEVNEVVESSKLEKRSGIQVRMFYDKSSTETLAEGHSSFIMPQARVVISKTDICPSLPDQTDLRSLSPIEMDPKDDEQVDDVISRYIEEIDPKRKGGRLEKALRKLHHNQVAVEEVEFSSIESPSEETYPLDVKKCIGAIFEDDYSPESVVNGVVKSSGENQSSSGSECPVSSSTTFLPEPIDLDESSYENLETESLTKENDQALRNIENSTCRFKTENEESYPFEGLIERNQTIVYTMELDDEETEVVEADEVEGSDVEEGGVDYEAEVKNNMTDRAIQVEDQEFEDEEMVEGESDGDNCFNSSQGDFMFEVVEEEVEEEEDNGEDEVETDNEETKKGYPNMSEFMEEVLSNKNHEGDRASVGSYESDESGLSLSQNPEMYNMAANGDARTEQVNCESEELSSSSERNNRALLITDSTADVMDSDMTSVKSFITNEPMLNGIKDLPSHLCKMDSGDDSESASQNDQINVLSIIDTANRRCLKCDRVYSCLKYAETHALLHFKRDNKFRCLINCCTYKASFIKEINHHLWKVHKVKNTEKCYDIIHHDNSEESNSRKDQDTEDYISTNTKALDELVDSNEGDNSDSEFPQPEEKRARLYFDRPPTTVSPTPSFEYEASSSGDSKAMLDLNSANESKDKLKRLMMQVIFGNESPSINGLDSM